MAFAKNKIMPVGENRFTRVYIFLCGELNKLFVSIKIYKPSEYSSFVYRLHHQYEDTGAHIYIEFPRDAFKGDENFFIFSVSENENGMS